MSTTEIYRLSQYDEKNQRIRHLPTRNQPDTRGTLISNFDSQTQVTMADSPLWTIDAEINVSRQALHRNSQPRQAPLLQYRFFSTEFRFFSVSSPVGSFNVVPYPMSLL
ncbi:unnamed protein product [Brassica oleracea var. botrytis]